MLKAAVEEWEEILEDVEVKRWLWRGGLLYAVVTELNGLTPRAKIFRRRWKSGAK